MDERKHCATANSNRRSRLRISSGAVAPAAVEGGTMMGSASSAAAQKEPRQKRRYTDAFDDDDVSSTSSTSSSEMTLTSTTRKRACPNNNIKNKKNTNRTSKTRNGKKKILKRSEKNDEEDDYYDYDDESSTSSTSTTASSSNDCCICMSKPGHRELASIDGCNHQYCFNCIAKWAETENTCPLCKKRFSQINRVHPITMHPNTKPSSSTTGELESTPHVGGGGGINTNALQVEDRNQQRPLARGAGPPP